MLEILHGCFAAGDLFHDLQKTSGSDTAWCTLSAGLIDRELQEEFCNVDHTVVFVHNDQTAGTHHGADCDQVIVIDRNIIVVDGNTSAGRTAGLCCLESFAVRDAAADLLDDFTESGSHLDLYKTSVVDLAAQCEDLCSFGFFGSHGSKPFRTI